MPMEMAMGTWHLADNRQQATDNRQQTQTRKMGNEQTAMGTAKAKRKCTDKGTKGGDHEGQVLCVPVDDRLCR